MDTVYVAFASVPDYHAGPSPYRGVSKSLEGAKHILYGDEPEFLKDHYWRKWNNTKDEVWEGPDGFGLIRLVEVAE